MATHPPNERAGLAAYHERCPNGDGGWHQWHLDGHSWLLDGLCYRVWGCQVCGATAYTRRDGNDIPEGKGPAPKENEE